MKNSSSILLGTALLAVGLFGGYVFGRWHTAPPSSMPVITESHHMSGMMADMNEGLRGKTGDDFDRAFLGEMVVHHQGAIDMANLVLTTSKRPELLELARNIITAQSQEITMMNDWKKTWFK